MTLRQLERVFYVGAATSVIATAYCALSSIYSLPGPRYNMSASMPRGWYWFMPGAVKRGAVVGDCLPTAFARYALAHEILLPSSHPCKSGVEPIVKTVAAIGGDVVEIAANGVTINGEAWPMSAVRRFDSRGRYVEMRQPNGRYVIAPNQVFLMGLNPKSWDSRYIGAVPRSTITGQWKPIYTE